MADLALGLAKSAVHGTVSKVRWAIEEEADLKERVQHDLVFITDEFQMMRSFLNGVDREQVKNVVVSTWVSQVRSLAYDIEDCIEFLVHLDSEPAWWHRLFPSCMAAVLPPLLAPMPLPLDEAVADLKQLKARVVDVSQRNMRYNLIADSGSGSSKPAVTEQQPVATGAAAFDLLVEAKETARKEGGKGDITQLITMGGSELRVISLWGTDGDLGISSTIREAYNNRKTCKKFGCRAWVKLVHPFNLHSLLQSLMNQFNSQSNQKQGTTTVQGDGLLDEFVRLMKQQRYLIVLEDLSTVLEWDAIRTHLLDWSKGSRIIISTQNFEIASLCTRQPYLIWELKYLSVNHSICALFTPANETAPKGCSRGDLSHLITKEGNELRVISLWGTKRELKTATSIIRDAYNNRKICQSFGRRGCVKLVHPFNIRDLLHALLAQFNTESGQEQGTTKVQDDDQSLVDEFKRQVKEQRYLIVLEGITSMIEWDAIKIHLPDQRNGSRVIISTQDSEIARVCTRQPCLIWEVGDLTVDHSVRVLYNEAKETAWKERGLDDLSRLITKEGRELGVTSLWGTDSEELKTATSIIRDAYNSSEICRNFGCRGWVKLVHPFNIRDLLHALLAQFNPNYSSQEQGGSRSIMVQDEESIMYEFKRQVNEQRYLVVLECLTSIEEWDAIRVHLPDWSNGSQVVISTQDFEIASQVIIRTRQPCLVWEPKDLSANHSVCVLYNEGVVVTSKEEAEGRGEGMHHVGRVREMIAFGNLVSNPSHKVVSVRGIWGVGKSRLVRQWQKLEKLEDLGPFERFGWVNVPRPFNLRDFSRSLLLDLCPDQFRGQIDEIADSLGMSRIRDPIRGCRKLLRDRRYLVVIDGLTSTEEWDLIKENLLADGRFASSIVVTTNEANVARHCAMPSTAVLKLKCIEADQAINLFKQVVQDENLEIKGELRQLILKCGGLTKVITDVARLLISKKNRMDREQTVKHLNSQFIEELESNPELDSLRGLFTWMHSYLFQACPDFPRPSVLYLSSIFPGNYNVRRRRLIMRWVAEGYSKDTESLSQYTSDQELGQDNGETFFSQLVELDVVQNPPRSATTVYTETKMVLCQVNAFLHEYAISQSLKDNIASALEVLTLKGSCHPTTQRRGRHLVIEDSWDRNRIVFGCVDFSRLRSLTVFGKWESFFICDTMKLLRVLDLEDASGVKNDDLEKMMKILCRLKFLSLRGCTEISLLPRSLGKLRQLQTLDVRHTSIVTLPSAIGKLQKLQYLRAGTAGSQWTPSRDRPCTTEMVPWFRRHQTAAGVMVSAGIKKVITLNTLGVLNANVLRGKAILEDLKELTQLRKLGVSGINRRNNEKFSSLISVLKYLQSLSVWLSEDNEHGCLDGISQHPPEKLFSLKLYYGHVDRLPVWINQLKNLRKLDLEMIMPTKEDMHILGLLKLCILRLSVNPSQDGDQQLIFSSTWSNDWSFRCLEVLEIACNSRLSLIQFEPRVMHPLGSLTVRCYGGQPSLRFSGLKNLKRLKEVCLEGTYNNAVVEDLRTQITMCRKKPALKVEEQPSS